MLGEPCFLTGETSSVQRAPGQVDWHKGTALTHLVDALGLSQQPDVVAIYVGDDHTDEDAFRTLEETQRGRSWILRVTARTAVRWARCCLRMQLGQRRGRVEGRVVADPCAAACCSGRAGGTRETRGTV